METFRGIVDKIIYTNAETGYTVLAFNAKRNMFVAVGTLPPIEENEYLKITGDFVQNKRYGTQFNIKEVEFDHPDSKSEIYIYLSSGLFYGIGEKTAKLIVDYFGEKTFEILDNDPERLMEVPGIGIKKVKAIIEAYENTKVMKESIIFLQKYDISLGLAIKIYKRYGESTIAIVRENPYILATDLKGIGFITADRIAKNIGISETSDFRIMAGIRHILTEEAASAGHTCLPEAKLLEATRKLLNIDLDIIKKVYDYTPDLIREVVDDEILVSVSVNYYIEQAIAYKCLYINENHENNTEFDIDRAIQAYERRHNFFLDDGQIDAVKSIFNSGVSVITGGPGTGKTTIIKVIVDIFMDRNKRFELCAPTGRASKRMTQATGIESKTIHRLIGYSSENHQNMYNENNQLNTDVVIIDEISMCDIYIFYALLKALPPKCRLILVGDKDQLPSVSCGNILSDIIRSGVINVVSLKMVHRQDETSSIVTNAHRINEGEMPISKGVNDFFIDQKVEVNDILNAVSTMVKYRIPSYLNINQSDIQVIAPMRNGECGVNMLNALLQKELNPSTNTYMVEDTKFKLGDRVMHIKNNYDLTWVDARTGLTGTGVFNGDLGYVEQVRNNGLVVRFEDDRIVNYEKEDLKQLALAYCISVHKSQGSEFPVVILVLSRYSPMLVTRNLIYTAVTRAKRMVVIVGSKEILKRGVENNYTAKRYTLLKHFLEVTGTSDGTNKSNKAYDEAVFLIPDNINLSYDDIFNDDKK